MPKSSMAFLSTFTCSGSISVKGSRRGPTFQPIRFMAFFTGMGFTSQKRASQRGRAFSCMSRAFWLAAQRTVWGRLCGLLGEVTPQALLAQPQTALQALGLSARKVDYMRGIARQVVDGELDLPGMAALEDAEVCRRLAALRGIGVWTAEMLLLFSLQRPDILSYDDLAIRRGLRMLYRHKEMPRERFERYRRRFSPYGSLASLYLWAIAGGALPELDDPAERKKGRSRPAASLKSTVTKD